MEPTSNPTDETSVEPRQKPVALDKQGRLLLVFMVIAGYAVTFFTMSGPERSSLTAQNLVFGISFGLICLLLALNSQMFFDRVPAGLDHRLASHGRGRDRPADHDNADPGGSSHPVGQHRPGE